MKEPQLILPAEGIDGVGGYPRPFFDNIYDHYAEAHGWYQYGRQGEKVDGAGGLNMSFRRKVLVETGGFNPAFRHIADDAEMNARLTRLGYKLKVDASITVRHRCCRSFSGHVRMLRGRGKGALIYHRFTGAKEQHFPLKTRLAEMLFDFGWFVRRAWTISQFKGLRYFLPFLFIELTGRWLYCEGYERARKTLGRVQGAP